MLGAARARGQSVDHLLFAGAPGPRQDHAVGHRRRRARGRPAHHERSGARARRRPRRDPHQPRRRRRPLHRRDPPPPAARRRGALSRDGGLPARHRHRQGPVGAFDPPRAAALHARRSHHPHRPHHRPAARSLRLRRAPRLLRHRRPRRDRRAHRPHPRRAARGRRARTRSRAAARGTPRIANRLLKRVRDYAEVRADGRVTTGVARDALVLFEVDELGLDKVDRAILTALCVTFSGRPVGLHTLAVAVAEEPDTIEEVYEPFLLTAGLLDRTPRGRVATPEAFAHLVAAALGPTAGPNLFDAARRHGHRVTRRYHRPPAATRLHRRVQRWDFMEIALIYFAVLALAFFLLIVRPQRRRAAAHRQFVATLSVGDEVMTSGGVFGTIRGPRTTTRSSSRSLPAPSSASRDRPSPSRPVAAAPDATGAIEPRRHRRRPAVGRTRALSRAQERHLPRRVARHRARRARSPRSCPATRRCSASTCAAACPSCCRRWGSTSPTRSTSRSTSSATGSTASASPSPRSRRQGSDIVVDLPGVKDRCKAERLVGQTAELRFRPVLIAGLPPVKAPTTTTTTGAPGASTTTSTEHDDHHDHHARAHHHDDHPRPGADRQRRVRRGRGRQHREVVEGRGGQRRDRVVRPERGRRAPEDPHDVTRGRQAQGVRRAPRQARRPEGPALLPRARRPHREGGRARRRPSSSRARAGR